jgi:hypothetical protein
VLTFLKNNFGLHKTSYRKKIFLPIFSSHIFWIRVVQCKKENFWILIFWENNKKCCILHWFCFLSCNESQELVEMIVIKIFILWFFNFMNLYMNFENYSFMSFCPFTIRWLFRLLRCMQQMEINIPFIPCMGRQLGFIPWILFYQCLCYSSCKYCNMNGYGLKNKNAFTHITLFHSGFMPLQSIVLYLKW